MTYPWSEKEVFSITPVLSGAGRGFGRFLLGAALITVGVMSGGVGFGLGPAGLAGGFATKAGVFSMAALAGNIGVALAIGGISQMMSPQPTRPKEANKNESFGFGGVINTINQGVPVPICYGRLYVGSAVISVGLDTDQVV